MPPLWEQLLPLVLCLAGLVVVARIQYVRTRDAPDGRRYAYWNPRRKRAVGIKLALFALICLIIAIIVWLDPR